MLLYCTSSYSSAYPIKYTNKNVGKFSAISGEQANTRITRQRASYTVPYSISFNRKPDVGLSVYNMQFDYNPEFSINVVQ